MKYKKNEVVIKRIKSTANKYVDGILALYKYYFPDTEKTNYSEDEARTMMNVKYRRRRISEVENITLAAILKDEVIGFVFCHFYPESRKAIISYIAVSDSRNKTSHKLVSKLKKILIKSGLCDELFFETEGSDANKGLIRWFSERAKSIGFNVRLFNFQYQCPMVSMSHDSKESHFFLFCIGIKTEIPELITKSKMLEILKFIYFDCYGDLYDVKDKLFLEHYTHLQKMFENAEKTLPDVISTIDGSLKLKSLTTLELLHLGENKFVEFKSTFRWNLKEGRIDKSKEEIILKTISAFNNGKGGKLFIGVSDKGEPIGLDDDYKSLKINTNDKFQIHLRNVFNEEFGKDFTANQIKIEFPIVNEIEICEITVKKGIEPLYCRITDKNGRKSPKLFVRNGNSSTEFETPEAISYIKKRFKKII